VRSQSDAIWYPTGGNGRQATPPVAADFLIGVGAVMLAASLPLIALRFLSPRPGLFPFVVLGTFVGVFLLRRPHWIIPGFIALVWTAIEQSFFGGLPSPIETGGMVLLAYAIYQGALRFDYAKEVLVVCALIAAPLLATAIASPDGMALPVDRLKNLSFIFLVALTVRTVKDFDRTAVTLSGVGVLLGIGALYSVFVHPITLFPLLAPTIPFQVIPPRAAGPVGDPNFFALVMAALVPFTLYVVARGGRRQLLGIIATVCLIGGVFATGSRGGLIAVGVSIIGAGVMMPVFRLRVAAAVVVIAAVVALPLFATQTEDASGRTVEGRLTENLVGVAMFSDHPIMGVGPGEFPAHYRDYTRFIGNDPRPVREAHSLPLEIAAEQGLAGVIGFLVAFVTAFRFAWTRGAWRLLVGRAVLLSIATYMTASLFLHGDEIRLLWVLLGLLLALGYVARREAPENGLV
jgi:O-antigen ligase